MKLRHVLLVCFFLFSPLLFSQTTTPFAPSIRWVTWQGKESNNCLTESNACLSIYRALEELPGGSTNPPTAGTGTVYVISGDSSHCVRWNSYTSPAVGLGIMTTTDPNYANPPSGWMHKGSTFAIRGIPNQSYASSGNGTGQACVTTLGTAPATGLALDETSGEVDGLYWTNTQPTTLGFDSAGVSEGNPVSGLTLTNDAMVTTENGASGPTVRVGQLVFSVYMNSDTLGADCNQVAGSDAGANILFDKQAGWAGASFGFRITNSNWYCGGGIKYRNISFQSLTVENLGIEAYGSNQNPAVWFVGGANCFDCTISNIELQDYTTSVFGVVNDSTAPSNGQGIVCVNCGSTQGAMTTLGTPQFEGSMAASALRNGESGFVNGSVVGRQEWTPRMFSPVAIRFMSGGWTNASLWTNSGGNVTTGVASLDGTHNAGQFNCPSGTCTGILGSPPNATSVNPGDYILDAVWTRSVNGAPYFSGGASPIQQQLGGAPGSCSYTTPVPGGDGEWQWQQEICHITAGASGSYYMPLYIYTQGPNSVQAYAPVIVHIPAGTMSDNEVYAYYNSMTPYNSSCVVGTVCGMIP